MIKGQNNLLAGMQAGPSAMEVSIQSTLQSHLNRLEQQINEVSYNTGYYANIADRLHEPNSDECGKLAAPPEPRGLLEQFDRLIDRLTELNNWNSDIIARLNQLV